MSFTSKTQFFRIARTSIQLAWLTFNLHPWSFCMAGVPEISCNPFFAAKFFPRFAPSETIFWFLWFERLSIPSVLQDHVDTQLRCYAGKGRMIVARCMETMLGPNAEVRWQDSIPAYVKSHVWETWSFQSGHCFETNGPKRSKNPSRLRRQQSLCASGSL